MIANPPSARFETDFLEVIRLLVSAGADINGTDADGWTPLDVAASWSLYSAVKTLMILGNGDLDFDAATNDERPLKMLPCLIVTEMMKL